MAECAPRLRLALRRSLGGWRQCMSCGKYAEAVEKRGNDGDCVMVLLRHGTRGRWKRKRENRCKRRRPRDGRLVKPHISSREPTGEGRCEPFPCLASSRRNIYGHILPVTWERLCVSVPLDCQCPAPHLSQSPELLFISIHCGPLQLRVGTNCPPSSLQTSKHLSG